MKTNISTNGRRERESPETNPHIQSFKFWKGCIDQRGERDCLINGVTN